MVITGKDNQKVKLTVDAGGSGYPSDTVTIATDADGNDAYESEQTLVAWSTLTG